LPRGPHQIRTWRFPPSGSSAAESRRLPTPYLDSDKGRRERKRAQHLLESLPRRARLLAPTPEPFPPRFPYIIQEHGQLSTVTVCPEGVEVPVDAPDERGVLVFHRPVPVATAPVVDGLHRPPQTRTPCLAPHLPPSPERSTPV